MGRRCSRPRTERSRPHGVSEGRRARPLSVESGFFLKRRENDTKKSRFSDEQIVRILLDSNETKVAEATRKHEITGQSLYRWPRLYGGMEVCGVKDFKIQRDGNTRLQKRLAERDVEFDVMKVIKAGDRAAVGFNRNVEAERPAP